MSDGLAARYSPRDEVANTATHGLGMALSIAGLCVMVVYASLQGGAYRIVGASIFGASMVALYLSSTLYHVSRRPRLKQVFRVLDHSAIYLLIAGSYTPFTLISLRGGWGWSLFGVIWGLAVCGVFLKIFFVGRFQALSVAVYLAMGWLAIIAFKPVLAALPTVGFLWLAAGGIMYTVGVVFYAWRQMPYHHAVWHLFVLAGTACHFVSVFFYVLPKA